MRFLFALIGGGVGCGLENGLGAFRLRLGRDGSDRKI